MGMYDFNDCGVCINPDTIELTPKSRIELCQHKGKWFNGFKLNYVGGYYGSPCCVSNKAFSTRKEARDDAFTNAIVAIEMEIGWYERAIDARDDNGYGSSLKQCRVLLQVLKDKQVQLPLPIQLSLFDLS